MFNKLQKMKKETREVIFEIPDTTEYRFVCSFGDNYYIDFAWWCFIEKKIYYKKWLFFG